MSKLYVIAGHTVESPGALAYNGRGEHSYTQEQQNLISAKWPVMEMEGSAVLDNDSMSLSRVIEAVNGNSKRGDYGIDLHFNNNNPEATGVEIFVSPRTTQVNRKIATDIVNGVSGILKIPVRRWVGRRDYKYPTESPRGRLGIIEQTKIPIVLLETCFLNSHDLTRYEAKKNDVAELIIEVYKMYKYI